MLSFLRTIIFGICLPVLLLGGCGCNQSVPLDEIDEPVAYVGRPPSGLSSLFAEAFPRSVSPWGNRELMLLDAATGETWQLTSNGENDYQPVWSPSGTHLMYLGLVNRPFEAVMETRLYVYDLKQGTNRQVDLSWARESGPASLRTDNNATENDWLDCAAWSPVDSTKIAVGVQVERFGGNRVVVLDTQKRSGRLLAESDERCMSLSWSATGKHLVFRFNDWKTELARPC